MQATIEKAITSGDGRISRQIDMESKVLEKELKEAAKEAGKA